MAKATPRVSASPGNRMHQGVDGVEGYVRCPPGEICAGLRRGDLVLIRGTGWLAWIIRLAAWRRLPKDDLPYAYWSHAALVVNDAGHLLEVHARGVGLCSIEKYRGKDFCYVRLDLDEAGRHEATRYATARVGQPYDLTGFLLLGVSVALGGLTHVPDTGRPGCVSLIAQALERPGIVFDRPAPELMPADLAKRFGVLP